MNTAPAEVLKALDPSMTDTVVTEMIGSRSSKPLTSPDDLKKIAGIDGDAAFRLGKLAGFKSKYFRIRVAVDIMPGRLQLDAYVQRGKGDPKVVYWKVNG